MANPRPALDDRYSLLRQLGQGGFADVWLARDLRDGGEVAIKVFRGAAPSLELDAARRLDHPNIVRLLDSGRADGAPYLAFEYVEGDTLREVLRSRGPLTRAEATSLASGIAGALDYAHGRRVLHNDVKPENIILAADGPRLLDFGSARSLRDTLQVADASAIAGTIAYMAPEVLAGEQPTTRSDIYGFALVVYEALTGAPPRSAASFGLTAAPDASTSPPRVDALVPGLPPEFAAAMQRALSPVAGVRPASAVELALALQGAAPTVAVNLGAPAAAPAAVVAEPAPIARTAPPALAVPAPAPPRRPRLPRTAVAAASAAAALVGTIALLALASGDSPDGPSNSATASTRDPAAIAAAQVSPSPTPIPPTATVAPQPGGDNRDEDAAPRGPGNGKGRGKRPKDD